MQSVPTFVQLGQSAKVQVGVEQDTNADFVSFRVLVLNHIADEVEAEVLLFGDADAVPQLLCRWRRSWWQRWRR